MNRLLLIAALALSACAAPSQPTMTITLSDADYAAMRAANPTLHPMLAACFEATGNLRPKSFAKVTMPDGQPGRAIVCG